MENWKKAIQNIQPALELLFRKFAGNDISVEIIPNDLTDEKETVKAISGYRLYKTIEQNFQAEALIGFAGNWPDAFESFGKSPGNPEKSEAESMFYKDLSDTLLQMTGGAVESIGVELQVDPVSEIDPKKVKTILNLKEYYTATVQLKGTESDGKSEPILVLVLSAINEKSAGAAGRDEEIGSKFASEAFQSAAVQAARTLIDDLNETSAGSNLRMDNNEGDRVEFEPFDKSQDVKNQREIRNIDLLRDVEMQVTVELGRKRMQLGRILQLMKGSVVELEKLAGEPVDIFVNGRCIATGDVVVIDEHFGVRITQLMAAHESMRKVS